MNNYSFICPVKPRDELKVEHIFQATLLLVKQNGLAGITMSEIAKAANIATGTLYIYFESKEKLINELFTRSRKSSAEIYFKGYNASHPFKEGLQTIWFNLFNFRIEHFEDAVFMDQCYHSPYITESTKELTKKLMQPLYKLVERGKEEKLLKNIDAFMLLVYMFSGLNEFVKHSVYSERKITKASKEELFNLMWDGIKA
ncbi:MAG: TetR/AcrR family transcriptional regulator [Bacteroidota bacterium]